MVNAVHRLHQLWTHTNAKPGLMVPIYVKDSGAQIPATANPVTATLVRGGVVTVLVVVPILHQMLILPRLDVIHASNTKEIILTVVHM
jgi:hypothetical protein